MRGGPAAGALVPIQRADVFGEALSSIAGHIDANGLQPGDRLPSDRELAATLGVSRPLVRQALKVLEGLGRVTALQGSGTFVQDAGHRVAVRELVRGLDLDRRLLAELQPVRIAIDTEAARAACRRRTPASLAALRAVLDEAGEPAGAPGAGLDLSFERALGQASGSEVLRRLQAVVHDLWLEAQVAAGLEPADPENLRREHRAVLDAIEAGDADLAASRLRDHLTFLPPDA